MAYEDPSDVAVNTDSISLGQRMTIESHSSYITNKRLQAWLEVVSQSGMDARVSTGDVPTALQYWNSLVTVYISFMTVILNARTNHFHREEVGRVIGILIPLRNQLITLYYGNNGENRAAIMLDKVESFVDGCSYLEVCFIQALQNLQYLFRTVRADPKSVADALAVFKKGHGGMFGQLIESESESEQDEQVPRMAEG
jgi:hypothetical protein